MIRHNFYYFLIATTINTTATKPNKAKKTFWGKPKTFLLCIISCCNLKVSCLSASISSCCFFPALANIPASVGAKLPDDVSYDPITYATQYSDKFILDDGNGNLSGNGVTGTINYETGAIDMQGMYRHAEFVVSASYNAPLSGKTSATESTKINALAQVYGNIFNQKGSSTLKVEAF